MEVEPTYNLKNDMNSGAIEVYSPNTLNDRIDTFERLMLIAKLHGCGDKPLKCAKSLMSMYALNYANKEHYPEAQVRIENWNRYIKHKIT